MIARFEDFGHPAYSEARTQRQLFGLVYPSLGAKQYWRYVYHDDRFVGAARATAR